MTRPNPEAIATTMARLSLSLIFLNSGDDDLADRRVEHVSEGLPNADEQAPGNKNGEYRNVLIHFRSSPASEGHFGKKMI